MLDFAHLRLMALELAEGLGNVTHACQEFGTTRSTFYRWRRRFRTEGIDGLKNRKSIHPKKTPHSTEMRIGELALQHPGYGCRRISAALIPESGRLSATTIQKILNRLCLGTRYDRWIAVQSVNRGTPCKLTGEQLAFLASCPQNSLQRATNAGDQQVTTNEAKVYLFQTSDDMSNLGIGTLAKQNAWHRERRPISAVGIEPQNDAEPLVDNGERPDTCYRGNQSGSVVFVDFRNIQKGLGAA